MYLAPRTPILLCVNPSPVVRYMPWSSRASVTRQMSTAKQPIHLVLDWDGTMTTSDTTATIGARVLSKAHELALPGIPAYQRPEPMSYYSEFYMREYKLWKEKSASVSQGVRAGTIAEIVSQLSASREIEERSFMRVRAAALNTSGGISALAENGGLREGFMQESGREAVRSGEVKIREPEVLKSLLASASESGSSWSILSVSWSRQFILGAMMEVALIRSGESDDIARRIRSNELLGPLSNDQGGRMKIICTAQDKLDAFNKEVDEVSANDDDMVTMYVGDSSTDIGCLAGPALGIYLSQDRSDDPVLNILDGLGIECLSIADLPIRNVANHLRQMRESLRRRRRPPHTLCVIKDFSELLDWVSKIE